MKYITSIFIVSIISLTMSITYAQEKDNSYEFGFPDQNYWAVEGSFGIIAAFGEDDMSNIGDNVNVGMSLAISKTFESGFFMTSGFTFSTFRDTGLWDNPLKYLSADVEAGYKFRTSSPFEPFIALGTSYVYAPNTIEDSDGSLTFNASLGALMWFKDSRYALSGRWRYKGANSVFVPSHTQLLFGLVYKFDY